MKKKKQAGRKAFFHPSRLLPREQAGALGGHAFSPACTEELETSPTDRVATIFCLILTPSILSL